uniref:Uncharacterized protein n=1 Tax=Anguilla anguilla TaxID=7936 RepID=A0A0E9T5T2_ANGAN
MVLLRFKPRRFLLFYTGITHINPLSARGRSPHAKVFKTFHPKHFFPATKKYKTLQHFLPSL